jgi:enamine deaminase RidA (YjgF/YER057c/UK114 family)
MEPRVNTPLRPASIPAPLAAYSHGMATPAGARLVFTSGQLGVGDTEPR